MTSRYKQGDQWEMRLRGRTILCVIDPCRVDVSFQVIYTDQWQPRSECESLGCIQPYNQRSGQAGSACDSYGVNILDDQMGLCHCFFDDRHD